MKKLLLAFVLVFVSLFTFAACKGGEETEGFKVAMITDYGESQTNHSTKQLTKVVKNGVKLMM